VKAVETDRGPAVSSSTPVDERDIVVLGASAGGVEALLGVLTGVAAGYAGTIFVVLHVPASGSALPGILTRRTALEATHPEDGEAIRPGRIYVAPPDRHLVIEDRRVRVLRGPRQNGHRPAVDPLFRSAARVYGPRVLGVVLSGALDDGTLGLAEIKQEGGYVVAQDPEEALYPSMPTSAARTVGVDAVLTASEIGTLINAVAPADARETGAPVPEQQTSETAAVDPLHQVDDAPGTASVYSCPECGGVLMEHDRSERLHFLCRVGHAYSPGVLAEKQQEGIEDALWGAIRALEESASLARRLATRASDAAAHAAVKRFREREQQAMKSAAQLRTVVSQPPVAGGAEASLAE
jgi:two-component system chemotaxis response regulator CheB